jgi:hypothetical protein
VYNGDVLPAGRPSRATAAIAKAITAVIAAASAIVLTSGIAIVARGAAQPPVEARTFAPGAVPETDIVTALAEAAAERFRPIGTTSLTFQVELAGPIDAAFRPESRAHPRGWLAEVAAYRIARGLGLDVVPPAVIRPVERGPLRRRLDPEADVMFEDLEPGLIFTANVVRGAFVYWVPGLERTDLDTGDGIERWSAWLAQGGEIPEEERTTARDLSNMVVLDYVIGNRDRWSGGNVRRAGGRLVIRDHNLAFPFTLTEAPHRRMLSFLMRAERFSRATIARLVELDEASLRELLADQAPSSVLDDRQIAAVLERREAVLSWVGALIEAHGQDAVLFFE